MSKLARSVILFVLTGIALFASCIGVFFCAAQTYDLAQEKINWIITNKLGFYCCLASIALSFVALVTGTIIIWVRKKVPDITVGK